MNIIYECEVCFFQSRNKKDVEVCEATEKKNRFSLGDEIEFFFDDNWIKGTIVGITFRKRTHFASYRIKSEDPQLPLHMRGRPWPVPEANIKKIS